MEPWDGPAALAATDGRWVIARNALLIVGSEAGMVKLDESEIVEKGRVGPGQSIGVDLDTATFFTAEAMKDMLAARQPFGEWAKRIRQIDHIVKTDAPEPQGNRIWRKWLFGQDSKQEFHMETERQREASKPLPCASLRLAVSM